MCHMLCSLFSFNAIERYLKRERAYCFVAGMGCMMLVSSVGGLEGSGSLKQRITSNNVMNKHVRNNSEAFMHVTNISKRVLLLVVV